MSYRENMCMFGWKMSCYLYHPCRWVCTDDKVDRVGGEGGGQGWLLFFVGCWCIHNEEWAFVWLSGILRFCERTCVMELAVIWRNCVSVSLCVWYVNDVYVDDKLFIFIRFHVINMHRSWFGPWSCVRIAPPVTKIKGFSVGRLKTYQTFLCLLAIHTHARARTYTSTHTAPTNWYVYIFTPVATNSHLYRLTLGVLARNYRIYDKFR